MKEVNSSLWPLKERAGLMAQRSDLEPEESVRPASPLHLRVS